MSSSGMWRRVALLSSQPALIGGYCYVPSSFILFTLMIDAIPSSETSVLRVTGHHTSEDVIPHGHRRERNQIVHVPRKGSP
jgi:hypothetical protein